MAEIYSDQEKLLPYSLKSIDGLTTDTTNAPEQVGLFETFLPIAFNNQEIEYEVRLHTSVQRLLFPEKLTIDKVDVNIVYPHADFSVVDGFMTMKYSQIKANIIALANAIDDKEEDPIEGE